MSDYPRTVLEFNERFHDDAACRTYLESIRWPEGARCPRCPQAKVWTMKVPFYRCAFCGHDFTVTAGTLFADTHLPLRWWFQAMWYVVNQKSGASAWGSNACWGWEATAPPGAGCTNCGERWCDQAEIVSRAPWKWASFISVASGPASAGAGRQERRWG
jgi:transposase-like protein